LKKLVFRKSPMLSVFLAVGFASNLDALERLLREVRAEQDWLRLERDASNEHLFTKVYFTDNGGKSLHVTWEGRECYNMDEGEKGLIYADKGACVTADGPSLDFTKLAKPEARLGDYDIAGNFYYSTQGGRLSTTLKKGKIRPKRMNFFVSGTLVIDETLEDEWKTTGSSGNSISLDFVIGKGWQETGGFGGAWRGDKKSEWWFGEQTLGGRCTLNTWDEPDKPKFDCKAAPKSLRDKGTDWPFRVYPSTINSRAEIVVEVPQDTWDQIADHKKSQKSVSEWFGF